MSDLNFIMGYEDGSITDVEEIAAGFQKLVDNGLAWKLQGSYGRTAANLIQMGLVQDHGGHHA